MAFPELQHHEARTAVLRLLVPLCGGIGAAAVVTVGLVTAGISGWGMALSAVPGIAVLTAVGLWSLGQRSAGPIGTRPPVPRAARNERRVRVSLLFGESSDDVLVVDGLAEIRPASPRTPFYLVVRRPRLALADRAVVTFVNECCEDGQDLEIVSRGCSRRVLLRRGDTEVAVDLAQPARFRLG
jgi:hypothetical protein